MQKRHHRGARAAYINVFLLRANGSDITQLASMQG